MLYYTGAMGTGGAVVRTNVAVTVVVVVVVAAAVSIVVEGTMGTSFLWGNNQNGFWLTGIGKGLMSINCLSIFDSITPPPGVGGLLTIQKWNKKFELNERHVSVLTLKLLNYIKSYPEQQDFIIYKWCATTVI